MATPDWFDDCTNLFNRYSCKILSVASVSLLTGLFWYATRIEDKTDAMQEALHQIQLDVAVIRGRQNPVTIPAPGGIAMAQAEQ